MGRTHVLEAGEGPPVVFAIGGGGPGAMWAPLAAPQRVRAMVHVGCPALRLDTSAPTLMRLIGVRGLGKALVHLQGASPESARKTCRMMGDPLDDGPVGRELADVMARMAQLPGYADAWRELLAAFVRLRGQRPGMALSADDLRQLTMPLLYVWGDRDPFGSRERGRRAAQIAPDAGFVGIAGGHVPWLSDTEAVAAPIR